MKTRLQKIRKINFRTLILVLFLLSITISGTSFKSLEKFAKLENQENIESVILLDCEKYNPKKYKLEDVSLSAEEWKLYRMINEYRARFNLKKIPLSRSLTYVAQVHVWDLNANKPAKGKCNMHSWSSKGNWTACCYTSDHAEAGKMWNKPSELTNYTGNGYEISHGAYGFSVTAKSALSGWQNSSGHNNVITNKRIWADSDWKAIGIGLVDGYAVVWFGTEEDLAKNIEKK